MKDKIDIVDDKAMKYSAVLSPETLNWFDKNYPNSIDECAEIIIDAMKRYPFTAEQLQEWCVKLKGGIVIDVNLYRDIKELGELYYYGISEELSVERLKQIILE